MLQRAVRPRARTCGHGPCLHCSFCSCLPLANSIKEAAQTTKNSNIFGIPHCCTQTDNSKSKLLCVRTHARAHHQCFVDTRHQRCEHVYHDFTHALNLEDVRTHALNLGDVRTHALNLGDVRTHALNLGDVRTHALNLEGGRGAVDVAACLDG
jgi:hypothetical protein